MFQTDPFSLIIVLVGLSLSPFIAMIATSYLKIVVVMSLIRNALGIQSIPPNMVLNALAMILTFYIMAPVVSESWSAIVESQKAMAAKVGTVAPQAQGQGTVAHPPSTIDLSSLDLNKAGEPARPHRRDGNRLTRASSKFPNRQAFKPQTSKPPALCFRPIHSH